mgnify:CR=1 FL=1
MLYAGLDLSRKRLDFHLLDGQISIQFVPDGSDGLDGLKQQVAGRIHRPLDPLGGAGGDLFRSLIGRGFDFD